MPKLFNHIPYPYTEVRTNAITLPLALSDGNIVVANTTLLRKLTPAGTELATLITTLDEPYGEPAAAGSEGFIVSRGSTLLSYDNNMQEQWSYSVDQQIARIEPILDGGAFFLYHPQQAPDPNKPWRLARLSAQGSQVWSHDLSLGDLSFKSDEIGRVYVLEQFAIHLHDTDGMKLFEIDLRPNLNEYVQDIRDGRVLITAGGVAGVFDQAGNELYRVHTETENDLLYGRLLPGGGVLLSVYRSGNSLGPDVTRFQVHDAQGQKTAEHVFQGQSNVPAFGDQYAFMPQFWIGGSPLLKLDGVHVPTLDPLFSVQLPIEDASPRPQHAGDTIHTVDHNYDGQTRLVYGTVYVINGAVLHRYDLGGRKLGEIPSVSVSTFEHTQAPPSAGW